MSDIPVKIKKGLKATMPSQIEEGTIYVTTDTGVMYADVSSNERIRICDETAVSYMSQSLSEAQKSQARTNIGAGTPDSIKIIEATYYANGESTISSTEEEINALIEEGKNVCIDCFIEPEDRTFRFYFSTKTSSGTTLFVNTEISDGAPELKLLTLIGSTFMIITMPVPLRSLATESKDGLMSTEDKVKLDSIEEGAQVNVQSDLSQTDEAAADYVKGVIRQESLPEGYPYEEDVIYLETSISESYTKIDASWLELGKTYIVQYGDTSYELTAETGKSINLFSDSYIYIGCDISSRGAYGDYPFSIYRIDDSTPDSGGQMFIFKEEPSEPVHVRVSNPDTIIHTIDPKYLPEGYPYEEVTATDISGTKFDLDGFGYSDALITHNQNIPFELGQIWKVSCGNYSSDDCEVKQADDGTLYIGDTAINSIPFYITSNEGKFNATFQNTFRTDCFDVTCISGTVSEIAIHPMDEKFLPSSATAQSDWSVSNENDPAYVKNRTHYDDTTYIIRTQDDIYQLVNTAINGTSLDDAEIIEGLTFRVIVDGVVYDNVPIYYNCYIAGGKTWAIGDSYYGRSNSWATTDYGFCYHGHGGLAHNSDIFPNGIENIEVYTVERELKQLDPKYIKDIYHEEVRSISMKETSTDINYGVHFVNDKLAELLRKYKETSLIYLGTSDPIPYVYLDGTYIEGSDYCEYKVQWKSVDSGNPQLTIRINNYGGITVGYGVTHNNFNSATIEIIGEETIVHTIDPKYIKDMYYEESVLKDVEYPISGTDGGTHDAIPFVLGDKYYFAYCTYTSANTDEHLYGDPTLYEVLSDDTGLYIGDPALNSIPFCIRETSASYNANFFTNVKPYNMKIKGQVEEEIIHQIDQKYVPNADWSQNDSAGDGYIKNRTHYDSREIVSTILGGDSATLPEASYELNKEYKVQFGDTEYTCTIQRYYLSPVGCDMYILGGNPWSTDGYSEYPFSIVIGKSTESIENIAATINVPEAPASPITVSILFGGELKQLDPKYIKDMYYEEDRVRVMIAEGMYLYKISDEVPDSLIDLEATVWFSTPDGIFSQSGAFDISDDGNFASIEPVIGVSYVDNYELDGLVFPEKGVYFLSVDSNEYYTTGAEWGTTGTPDITWDGSATIIHTIDEKYLPESVITTPNWNATEGESGYIENRTHYEDGNCILKFTAVNNGSSYRYDFGSYGALESYRDLVQSEDTPIYVKMNDTVLETKHSFYNGYYNLYYGENNTLIRNYIGGSNSGTLTIFPKNVDPDYSADTVDICILTTSYYELKQIDEKFLPDSVKTQADHSVIDESDPAFIKNKTHWEFKNLVSTFDPSTDKMTPARYYEGIDYLVVVDGVEYITRVQHKHHSTIGLYHSFLGSDAGSIFPTSNANPPFSIYEHDSRDYPDLSAEEVEMYFYAIDNESSHTVEVYEYDLKKLDEKFLPVAEDDEILEMLMEQDMLLAVTDSDGSILSDENDNILLW